MNRGELEQLERVLRSIREGQFLTPEFATYIWAMVRRALDAASPPSQPDFVVGELVEKIGTYIIKGEVRSAFTMSNGQERYVVEHKAEGGGSFCHIYSARNIRPLTLGGQT